MCKNAVRGRVCDSIRAVELVDMVKYCLFIQTPVILDFHRKKRAERHEKEVASRMAQEADSKGMLVF